MAGPQLSLLGQAVSPVHELLTACWEWKPDCNQIQFEVPKDSKHDVMLWVIESDKPEGTPRWMMLLGGDVTPPIKVPIRPKKQSLAWVLTSLTLILLGVVGWRKFRG